MKKRLLSILLVLCMLLSLVPATVFAAENKTVSVQLANPFKDVKKSDWFYDAVQYARINGFFNGATKTAFEPEGTMTRGMFVTVLGRMAGVDAENYSGMTVFSDVPASKYYAPYVAWASKHGITTGSGDGKFSPDELINREQMATFFVRYFETFGVDYDTGANVTSVPADLNEIEVYARDAVLKLWKQGLLNGDGREFDPEGSATRAQTATLCMRTDEAVAVWYKEPGVPSDRVRINPSTGLPYDAEIVVPEQPTVICFKVTYTDGAADEEVFADQSYTVLNGAATPAFIGTPEREGYLFKGWNPRVSETVLSNVTYTAQWEAVIPEVNEYSVIYTDGVDGEELFADQTYPAEEGSVTPAFSGTPKREGYTFKGWNPEVAETVTGSVTYTAQWEAVIPEVNEYTVTYTDGVDGEEVFADQTTTAEEGSETPAFVGTPEREGYTFKGWNPTVAAAVTNNVTYTAQWEAVIPEVTKFTVTYTDGVDSEELFADQAYTVDEGSTTPTFEGIPHRDGYSFKGWNPVAAPTVTATVTYTAKWEKDPIKYTVTYTDGVDVEEVFADQTTTAEEGSSTPAFVGTPKREGYTFKGWNPAVTATVTGNVTYTAQWESRIVTHSVKFYDGTRLIDTMTVVNGEALTALPSTEKVSKPTGIFAGWFADAEFTTPFYAESPITENTDVYAQYTELPGSELTLTSFAQTELKEDAVFNVSGSGSTANIVLATMDGSDPVELVITPTAGGYSITAKDGFNPGSTYELTIPSGMNFIASSGEVMPESIRTATFTIKRAEKEQIEMAESTHFVQHSAPSSLRAGSTVTAPGINVGDLICFYRTTSPEVRNYAENAYIDDPETWFKAAAVNGDTVTLAKLEDADTQNMYNVPDNFPVIGDPTSVTGTLTLEADSDGYTLDEEVYAMMVVGDSSITANLAYAKSKVSIGDFLSIYASADSVNGEDSVYFGKITAYDEATGIITYILSSYEEIESAVDLYVKPPLSGDDLVSQEAKEEIEQTVLSQVQESGFAEDAAFILAELAAQTDGFKNMDGLDVLFTDENGDPLSDEEIALLNLGASFELSDDIELTIELITSGDQLHFEDEGSVQLAVGIDAQFEVEVEDDGKVCIDLSAVFAQELAMGLSVTGDLVWKEVLGFIPVPLGVKVGAALDLYSYTGVRFDIQAYTVAPEDESLFEQFKDVISNPEKLADVLPDDFAGIKEGLETVGDVFDKIEELEGKVEQCRNDIETAQAYAEDIAELWAAVDAMSTDKKYTKEEWKALGETFGKTNVSADLMDMMGLTTETELDADRYAESLENLLTKYSEMLEKKTDWVTLVEQEIAKVEVTFYGLVLFMKADFLVHTDMNIAMGASLQYQVGKRYNFWLKIGLFRPESGSSTVDLVDEQFAFQYYVMGKLCVKMGIKGSVGFAIGSADVASVALSIEIGPYLKLYGFFIYEYERTRAAGSSSWVSSERMAGALYLEFGLYLVVSLEAEALGLFEASYDLFDEEFPLLEAGKKEFPYAFQYEPADDELVLVQDVDLNSTNGITMELPEEYRAVRYCELPTGKMGATAFDWDDYNVYLSNSAFTMDKNGVISVTVPEDTRYMECDLVLTYKYGKLAFSSYDMQVTIPLAWTNLSADEISQYYTASVRVGNAADGYTTVWSDKVRKNEEFTLPTMDELKEIIGYNEAVYASIEYPNAGETSNVIANTSYDVDVTYTQYSVTVNGIQNADGSTESRTFYTTYGNTFDFSELEATGTEKANEAYTKFVNVTTEATITANKQEQVIDLTRPISGKIAEAAKAGITATANYADDSVLLTYVFSGIDAASATERIRKGSLPTYDFNSIAANMGMAVKSVSPDLGCANNSTTYFVECGMIVGESYTLYFDENGGDRVEDRTRVGGSLIGTLPVPTRKGYTFIGWYADSSLTTEFKEKLMPKVNTTVYAKWEANDYTVNFNVNGGAAWSGDKGTKTVTFGKTFGELPVPTRDNHAFTGWYTDTSFTTLVTEQSIVDFDGTQTLYAKWHKLVEIQKTFAYEPIAANPVYTVGECVELLPIANSWPTAPDGGPAIDRSEFTFKFMRQGANDYEDGYPSNAGTYDVTITRPADDYYAPFSQTITGILTIEKASSSLKGTLTAVTHGRAIIPTLAIESSVGDGAVEYGLVKSTDIYQVPQKWSQTGVLYDLDPGKYTVWARLGEGMNYNASSAIADLVTTTITVSASDYFSYKLAIYTADVKNAGTDSKIYGKVGNGSYTHFDKDDYNDFERGCLDYYNISVPNSLVIDGSADVTIKYEKSGTASGWKLDWIRLDLCDNGSRINMGDKYYVEEWFEDQSTITKTYTLTGSCLGRKVDASTYGLNYSNGSITISDTLISDNYKTDYDPYYYQNAPKLVAYFSNPFFNRFITRVSFTEIHVDWEGVKKAADEYHLDTPVLNYGIDFDVEGGVYGAADEMYTAVYTNTVE